MIGWQPIDDCHYERDGWQLWLRPDVHGRFVWRVSNPAHHLVCRAEGYETLVEAMKAANAEIAKAGSR